MGVRRLVPLLVVSMVLAGCFTGERPYFEEEQPAPLGTGDPAIDTVLDRLESADAARFTASFDIERRFGPVNSTSTVVLDGPERRSITVRSPDRSIRFIADEAGQRTCDLDAGTCTDSFDVQQVSDTVLTIGFYGPDIASRLRRDADARIGSSEAYEKVVADEPADCVDITVSGGTKTYCALESGVLAQFVGADFVIDLTSYSPIPDPESFTI